MAKSQRGYSPARGNFRFVKRTSFAALPARKGAALQNPLFLLGKNGVRGIGNGERRDENRLKNIFFACRASGHSDTLARPWRVETPIFALSPPIRFPTQIRPPATPPTAHFCSFSSIETDESPPNFYAPPPRFIVGYQNKGFENTGYNIAGNTFLTIGKAASEMTLGDLVPNEEFVASSIQFMTPGGANAKTTFKGKTVTAKYIYWTADDDPEEGAGWYLDADGDGEINQNAVALPMGSGFLVSRFGSEADAQLVYSGEVNPSPVTVGLPSSGYNVIGNCCPKDLTLGDITPNEDFVASSIQFMTPGGANVKTTFKGKTVTAKYIYWTADDDPEEGAGWYLDADGDGEVNQNDLVSIPAGGGFLVSRFGSEPDATVTIPSAL